MANKQISQLTAKPTPVASTDQFGIDDNLSQSWKITVANLQTYFTTLYLTLSGGTMTGNLTLNGDPTTNLMAATKQYVDAVASGLNILPSCKVATTAALTVAYSNGAAGVGATLTNAGAQAALSIDGVALSVNDVVLVKDQASTFQNGIYTVTNIGSGATNWVMTRATYYDTAAEVTPGDFTFILLGTANAQTQWVETATVATMGTDAITWNQFGADVQAVITAIQNNTYVYSEDTGAADAYVATLSPAIAAYTEGLTVILDVANANTGASTLAVNGLAAQTIQTPQGGALVAGDMVAGRRVWLVYTGTVFQLVNRNIEKRIQNDSFNYILDTGAADAYVATLVPAATAYVAGMRLSLKIANANATTTPTVDVNGLGAKTIVSGAGGALLANDLVAGQIADLRYDGTNFQLQSRNQAVMSNRTLTAAGLVTGGGDLSANRTFTVTAATQADQETGTSNTVAVTPGVQKYHPGHPKAWVYFTSVTTTAINSSFGVTSLTDGGTGITQVNYTTGFSSANVNVNFWANDGTNRTFPIISTNSDTSCTVRSTDNAGTLTDMAYNFLTAFGDL